MSATIREVVDDAQLIVGEITGPSTQAFSDDRMMKDAIRAFNMLFKKYYWDQYLEWTTVVLDGTTGKPTTNSFARVMDFEDFISVNLAGEICPLAIKPKRLNPNYLTGTNILYWGSLSVSDADYNNKKIRVYPATAIGSLDVLARMYPHDDYNSEWDWGDTMYLDRDMLAMGTAYMTLVGDDLNASAADMAKSMMEGRYKDILAALAKRPSGNASGNGQIPNRYYEVP